MADDTNVNSLDRFAREIGVAQAAPGEKPTSALKASDDLIRLWRNYDDYVITNGTDQGFQPAEPGLPVSDGFVTVDVTATNDAAQLLNTLRGLGLEDGTAFGQRISGRLPIDQIDDMAKLPEVKSAAPSYAVTQVGAITSQGDAAMNADDARGAFSVNGSGITVGVLSDSFDTGPGSYASDQASGDLPAGVNVLSDIAGGTDEGRAMAQLVYDVAPGSSLAYHTAFNGMADFAQGIIDLKNAGADVIVDDVIYFAEPMFLDGVVAQAVDQVASQGVPYFSSAGNQEVSSYEAAYRAMPVPTGLAFPFAYQSVHDFNPTSSTDATQRFTLSNNASVQLSFQWADPYFSDTGVGASTDLDILIFDTAGTLLASSVDANVGGDPVEIITLTNTSGASQSYDLVIASYEGPNPTHLKYVDFRDANFTEYATNSGASYGHASAEGGEGVGAAFYGNTPPFGTNPPVLEGFSSIGGTPILFNTSGARLASPQVRDRVDVTAPDGTDTTFFGGDVDANGFPNFFGTSAAAPHAAAVAALMLNSNSALNPSQVYTALEQTAVDMDNPYTAGFDSGKDVASGFGLVDANAAIGSLSLNPVIGTSGNDADLRGTAGADHIQGLGGNDTLTGLLGSDLLDGGTGTDRANWLQDGGTSGLTINLATGVATRGTERDTLVGIEQVSGSNFVDTITGNSVANLLRGSGGNDALLGGSGGDVLLGGTGKDTQTGGTAADRFDFDTSAEAGLGSTRDVILDFSKSQLDKIDLATIDARAGVTGNQAFSFIGTSAFGSNAIGQLRANDLGSTVVLQGSTDSDRSAEFEVEVRNFTGTFASGDFFL